MNINLYVTAKFTVRKEKLSNALALIKALTEVTKTEEGCIKYYYLQNTANECEFTSFEIWENESEERKHWETAHVQNALKELPNLLETSPEIIKWKALN